MSSFTSDKRQDFSPESSNAEVERLKRQCDELRARERKARAQADEARERLVKLTSVSKSFASSMRERRRFQEHFALQYTVGRMLSEADNPEEAFTKLLKILGEGFGWKLGVLWKMDEEAGVLRCSEVWSSPENLPSGFEEACRRASFPCGVGLPGRAWAAGKVLWAEDSGDDEDPRAEAVATQEVRSALAFPVWDADPLVVFEFFGDRRATASSEELLQSITLISDQVNQLAKRRRTEETLRQREKLYRLIAENSTDMISKHTPEGVYTYASAACHSLLGYHPDELVGRSAYEFFHPEDVKAIRETHSEILELPDTYTISYRIRRKDGSYIWFETTSRTVRDPKTGAAQEIIAVSRDISERRRIEEALRESEKRFRAFFDTAAVGMAHADFPTGRFLQVNRKLTEFLGYDKDELLTMTSSQITHPEDRARDEKGMSRLLRGEIQEYITEKRYLRKDKQILWGTLAVSLVQGDDGHPLCTAAVIQDSTERKIAEEALRESEERYKTLYEDNPSIYFTLDEEGTVLSINRFGAEQLGYAVEELVGRSMLDIFHEEDRESVFQHFHKCLQEGSRKTSAWEARKVRKDGSTFWARENLRVVRSPYSDRIVLVTCEDISERKRAEEERERSLTRELQVRAQSEERRRISRELHDRVAHTMGVVHQSLELYEALKGHDPATAEAKIELACEMAKEALASTRNLSMELRRPDVKQGLQAALENILHDIVPPAVHHELVAEGDESVLPSRIRNQLFLVLREAVRNAVTHSGCDRLTVELDITPQRVVGAVEDNGQGFEPEKVNSNNGLNSMQERASLVGGTLGVSSESGAGTRIEISIPLKEGS